MFTTGSKLLIGSSVLALVAAIVYGVTQTEALGIVGLVSAALCLAFLAGVNIWARDSNLSAMDANAVANSEASDDPPGASIWPMVFAVGATTVLLGLVSQQSIFTIGIVILVAAGAQWAVQAWAEGASGDAAVNNAVRSRLANPLEFPLLGAVAVGGIAYSMSRIMLWLSKTNTVIAFVILATLVALVAFAFAARPSVKRGVAGGALSLGAVAIVAGGVAAGVDGERDIHEHELIARDAAYVCDSTAEFEVDENASQTVSSKASTFTISLTSSGELTYDEPGYVESNARAITLPRANANNIVFRNDSGEERRLTLDVGAAPVQAAVEGETTDAETADAETTDGEAAAESGHGEEAIETVDGEAVDKSDRMLLCTTLVEDGGAQLLTVDVKEPSFAYADDDQAYRFYVPGTDAQLELIVP